jgi:hypothetical protein
MWWCKVLFGISALKWLAVANVVLQALGVWRRERWRRGTPARALGPASATPLPWPAVKVRISSYSPLQNCNFRHFFLIFCINSLPGYDGDNLGGYDIWLILHVFEFPRSSIFLEWLSMEVFNVLMCHCLKYMLCYDSHLDWVIVVKLLYFTPFCLYLSTFHLFKNDQEIGIDLTFLFSLQMTQLIFSEWWWHLKW